MAGENPCAQENPYPRLVRAKPPLLKRALARLLGRTRYYVDTEHFKQPTVIYLCYCKEHRVFFEDYLHGYQEYVVCPVCWEEEHWMDAEIDEDLIREVLWDEFEDEEELDEELEDEEGEW